MRSLRTALFVCGTLLGSSACRTAVYSGRADPSFDGAFTAVERALEDGDDARARELIDAVLARHPSGPTLARAKGLEGAVIERELGRYGPQFEALQAALADHDQAMADRILERLLATQPAGAALDRVQAFARIVEGRKLVAALVLELDAQPTAEAGTYKLVLHASHALEVPLRLHCGGSSLSFLALGIDPYGIEQRAARNALIDALDDLELQPNVPADLVLGTFHLEVRGLIASRGRWEFKSSMAGCIEREGQSYPAMNLVAAPLEVVRRDAGLPSEPVTPDELVSFVNDAAQHQELRKTPALLARAVRVENSRRLEALDALTPAVLRLGNPELACTVPVLRWLSGERELGADARVWRNWLQARVAARSTPLERRAPAELPIPPRNSETTAKR